MAFEGNTSKGKFPKGVFVNLLTINSIEDVESHFDQDISMKVIATSDYAKYNKNIWLSGNHKKEQDKPVDYGRLKNGVKHGSWPVEHFLEKIGLDPKDALTEDGSTLTDDIKGKCVGRRFYALEYESNNPKRSRNMWRFFSAEHEGVDSLLKRWNKQDDKWIPKDFTHKHGTNERLSDMYDNINDEPPV